MPTDRRSGSYFLDCFREKENIREMIRSREGRGIAMGLEERTARGGATISLADGLIGDRWGLEAAKCSVSRSSSRRRCRPRGGGGADRLNYDDVACFEILWDSY